ncbi:hypothetical protein, partial [Rhodoplanes sp. SY1]|uniref:hypothetical protein n=1 Tax=Rhodoplanes sp. SY1 TaxID=3166646 RepID=UPI0038B5A5E6
RLRPQLEFRRPLGRGLPARLEQPLSAGARESRRGDRAPRKYAIADLLAARTGEKYLRVPSPDHHDFVFCAVVLMAPAAAGKVRDGERYRTRRGPRHRDDDAARPTCHAGRDVMDLEHRVSMSSATVIDLSAYRERRRSAAMQVVAPGAVAPTGFVGVMMVPAPMMMMWTPVWIMPAHHSAGHE